MKPSFLIVTALTTISCQLYFLNWLHQTIGLSARPVYGKAIALYVCAQAGYLVWKNVRAEKSSQYSEIPSDEQGQGEDGL